MITSLNYYSYRFYTKFLFLNRSRFVIAIQDYKAPGEGTSFLSFLKGDVILLEEDSTGETVLNNGWCIGKFQSWSEIYILFTENSGISF